jgi:hypothetical protein
LRRVDHEQDAGVGAGATEACEVEHVPGQRLNPPDADDARARVQSGRKQLRPQPQRF